MANLFSRWRASLERLIFAGLKPDEPSVTKKPKSKIATLVESAEELASRGLKPEEKKLPGPMTLGQKLGMVAGILLVCVFVYVLVIVLGHHAEQAESKAPPPPPVEIVPKGFKVDKNKDLEVMEMNFNKTSEPKEITGTLRNATDHAIASCEVRFDVTTKTGAQLGSVSTTLHGLEARGTAKFRIPVPYKEAGFAMVRDLRVN